MTTEPTEARQDELAGIREKLACNFVQVLYDKGFITWETVGAEKAIKRKGYELADQILSLTVSSGGGKCPKCDGFKKVLGRRGTIMCYCPTCSSTGSVKKEEISIGDLIKEWKERR